MVCSDFVRLNFVALPNLYPVLYAMFQSQSSIIYLSISSVIPPVSTICCCKCNYSLSHNSPTSIKYVILNLYCDTHHLMKFKYHLPPKNFPASILISMIFDQLFPSYAVPIIISASASIAAYYCIVK